MPASAAEIPSLEGRVGPEEWRTRVELAAFYRLVAAHDMDDLTGTHISARVPGTENQFLLNPYGLLFEEVTASSLIKCDYDGNVLQESAYPLNAAGFTIHHAVLSGRPDVACAAHTHTVAGMAVASVEGGLRPIHQKAMRFYKRLSFHPYEGVADDPDECARLQADLGRNDAMLLENHGLIACGGSIRYTWALLYNLEKCCQAQVLLDATGAAVTVPSEELSERTYQGFSRMLAGSTAGNKLDAWESALRLLARRDPSFMH